MPTKKKPGRPRKKSSERRELYPVRLTLAERKAIQSAARRSNLTVSAWIRRVLDRAAKRKGKG